jgi:hypothetical protein
MIMVSILFPLTRDIYAYEYNSYTMRKAAACESTASTTGSSGK